MAATGYSPIQLYYSTTASAVPLAANLVSGELALNLTDGRLYYKDNAGAVQLLSTSTTANGTANGVLYLNGSKVATSGSALVFDGTNLGVGTNSPLGKLDARGDLYVGANARILITEGGTGDAVIGGRAGTAFLALTVNGSEQARLTSTGLGIGTSSPAYKLDVTGQIRASVASGSAQIRLERTATTAGASWIGADADALLRVYTTGFSTQLMLDSSGNLGLGVTPSAGSTHIDVSAGGSLYGLGNGAQLTGNANFSGGSWFYRATQYATRLDLNPGGAGGAAFYTAASGTAGNAITFTQAMTLDASGNLLLGTTTNLSSSFRASIEGGRLGVASASNAYALYLRYNNTTAGVYIGSPSADVLSFSNNAGTETARIDSSGNLIQSAPTTAPTLSTNGTMVFNLTSNTNLRVSVRGSDGVTRTANITLA